MQSLAALEHRSYLYDVFYLIIFAKSKLDAVDIELTNELNARAQYMYQIVKNRVIVLCQNMFVLHTEYVLIQELFFSGLSDLFLYVGFYNSSLRYVQLLKK